MPLIFVIHFDVEIAQSFCTKKRLLRKTKRKVIDSKVNNCYYMCKGSMLIILSKKLCGSLP